MKVTLEQCGEEGSGSIVLKSKTAPGLRFAAERHGPHTSKEDNWLFKRLQNEVLKLETDACLREALLLHMAVSHKIQ